MLTSALSTLNFGVTVLVAYASSLRLMRWIEWQAGCLPHFLALTKY